MVVQPPAALVPSGTLGSPGTPSASENASVGLSCGCLTGKMMINHWNQAVYFQRNAHEAHVACLSLRHVFIPDLHRTAQVLKAGWV